MAGNNEVYIWNAETNNWEKIGMVQGAKGDKGDASSIAIGVVTEGEIMSVENVGTSSDAILNFTLKKGEKGATGNAGTISIGNVVSGESASVTNVGTPENAIFDFILPKGEKGERGNPTIVNGKNNSNITLYGTDIFIKENDSTTISEKLDSVDSLLVAKADKTELDGWTSTIEKQEGDSEVTFDNLDPSMAYDIYADTSDGSIISISSCSKTDGTETGTIKLTYTFKSLVSSQLPTNFKLRIVK